MNNSQKIFSAVLLLAACLGLTACVSSEPDEGKEIYCLAVGCGPKAPSKIYCLGEDFICTKPMSSDNNRVPAKSFPAKPSPVETPFAPIPTPAIPTIPAVPEVTEEAIPVPFEATPVPVEAIPVPEEAIPVPEETIPGPVETIPGPEETIPVPEEATPVPFETEPATGAPYMGESPAYR